MEMISLQGKTNMFERKISEYSKYGVGANSTGGKAENTANQFVLDEDF